MAITVPPPAAPASSTANVFQGRANTSQTIAAVNVFTSVLLPVEDADDLGGHSTTTNTSRFTVPAGRAGLYSVSAAAMWSSGQALTAGTTGRLIRVAKNGAAIPAGSSWGTYVGATTGNALTLTVPPLLVTLAVGDFVELQAASGLANSILAGDANEGSFLRVDLVR